MICNHRTGCDKYGKAFFLPLKNQPGVISINLRWSHCIWFLSYVSYKLVIYSLCEKFELEISEPSRNEVAIPIYLNRREKVFVKFFSCMLYNIFHGKTPAHRKYKGEKLFQRLCYKNRRTCKQGSVRFSLANVEYDAHPNLSLGVYAINNPLLRKRNTFYYILQITYKFYELNPAQPSPPFNIGPGR